MTDETQAAENETVKPKLSLRFKIGVFFLAVNVPFGIGGGLLATAVGVKMGKPALGAGLGIGIYIVSWGMLGLGVWMAGPEGVELVKNLRKKLFDRKKEPPRPTSPPA